MKGTKRAKARAKAALREPSTWASIGAIAAVFIGVNPELGAAVAGGVATTLQNPEAAAALGTAVAGTVLGVLLPEGGKSP